MRKILERRERQSKYNRGKEKEKENRETRGTKQIE